MVDEERVAMDGMDGMRGKGMTRFGEMDGCEKVC
jgi:hypothetical protein